MANETTRRPLPGSYSEMYKSRFLKADMLGSKKVTLTIKAIFGEDLLTAEEETKPEWIVQFQERPIEWVMNRTNAFCLYRIFGGDPHTWIGRKITLYAQPGTWFGEKGEAIRVYGSPELEEDLPITLKFMRKKKDRNMVMHKVTASPKAAAEPEHPKPSREGMDPRILAGLQLMSDADADEFLRTHASYSQKDLLAALNAKLDENAA